MKKVISFFALTLFACMALPAQAQTSIQLGPRIGYEIDDVEDLFIGADARITIGALPVQINPTFDYYLVDEIEGADYSLWQLSVNALYNFGFNNAVFTPYAGVGIGFTRSSVDVAGFESSSTDTGFNLVGGARFGSGALQPFVQAQLTFGDAELTTIGGGVLFRLGGN